MWKYLVPRSALILLLLTSHADACWHWWCLRHHQRYHQGSRASYGANSVQRSNSSGDIGQDALEATPPPQDPSLDDPNALESGSENALDEAAVAGDDSTQFVRLNEAIGRITLVSDVQAIQHDLDSIKATLDAHQQELLRELAPLKSLLKAIEDRTANNGSQTESVP